MSKSLHGMPFVLVLFALAAASCAPAQGTPTPTIIPETPTLITITEEPTLAPTATATLVPVPLAGPQSGTAMKWIDASLLAYVPAGEFSMGSGAGDSPEHAVSLDAYWIQQTKVTNGMYTQCVLAGGCTAPTQEVGAPTYTNPEFSSHPVVGVTWDQATAYCTWAGGRLPTEAEWEKAGRGASGNIYPWGEEGAACDFLNFAGCINHTTGVTDFPEGRSPYGLYDMAGNVFEWVGDWYSETAYNDGAAMNPTGPASGDYRVIRGSSFETDPDQAASAIRHFMSPANPRRDVGFRCVVPAPQPLAPFCQVTAYVPGAGSAPQGACQLPAVDVRGQYCASGDGFVTLNISEGATYKADREDYECEETLVDGRRLITCKGPRSTETSLEVTVCNESCSTAPDQTGAAPSCDPGYALDTASGTCVYSPIAAEVGAAGCPLGYKLMEAGGQKSCALAPGPDGQCPAGLYLDTLYGACISPSGIAGLPYGINNPDAAQAGYAGCAPGYQYDSSFQCCQATNSAAYPGCPAGSTYSTDTKACVPTGARVTSAGCVTVQATTLKCSEPVDICSKITAEPVCRRNSFACVWDDKKDICMLKK